MAQGPVTVTSNVELLKEMWPQPLLDLKFYQNRFFAAAVPKVGDFYGREGAWHNVVPYAGPSGGGSRDFATARANRSTGAEADFIVRRKRSFQVIELDEEAIAASENEKGGVMPILRGKSEQALDDLARNHARDLHGNEGGARAVIAAGGIGTPSAGPGGGTYFTLAAAADVVAFELDQVIVVSAADGTSGALRAGAMRVIGVDRNISGTARVELLNDATGDGTVPAGWAAADFMFRQGDFGASYTGLGSWLPIDRTGLATPFLGVVRAIDAERLAGVFEDFRGAPIHEAIKRLATRVRINGSGSPDVAILNPLDYEVLESEMESTVRRQEVVVMPSGKRGARIGFDAIEVKSGNSRVLAFEDLDAPRGVVRVLQMNTWKFKHLKGIGHFAHEADSGNARSSEDADSREIRSRIWGNLGGLAPGKNGVGLIGS